MQGDARQHTYAKGVFRDSLSLSLSLSLSHTYTHTHTHTQRQTDRQTDRQTHALSLSLSRSLSLSHTHTHTLAGGCAATHVRERGVPGGREAGGAARPRQRRHLPPQHSYLTQSVFKSQFPHKSVNLSFVITNIMNKLTNSCGN